MPIYPRHRRYYSTNGTHCLGGGASIHYRLVVVRPTRALPARRPSRRRDRDSPFLGRQRPDYCGVKLGGLFRCENGPHSKDMLKRFLLKQIGRAHVRTPVTNSHIVCRLLLEKKKLSKKRK